ncbi:MAG: ATP-grasp domain-containing protein [Candidatus Parcubacteria bacterium]|nr:ATP-grasp domain-containing protein [Candidatus Parcubacteria bacterium]
MRNGNNFEDKTILVVNTGSIKKRFILQKLKRLGLKVVCLNKEKNWAAPYIDHWILADNTNQTECINAIKEFIASNPEVKISGVVTFWEDDVLLTAKIADKFNWVGIPYNIAKKVRNKYLFRDFCEQNGIATPKHVLLKSVAEIQNLPDDFKFPVVIKPAYGASSAFVIKVNGKDDLANTYNYIKKNISTTTESALADGLDIFVEEYIDGDEVDIDIIIQNGKVKFWSISDNFQTQEPFFVEVGQSIPSSLPALQQQELFEQAEETLEKLGLQNGIVHWEAKSTPHGPVPIEINLRMGGDYIYSYIKGCWGVDLIEYAVKVALGYFIKIKKPDNPLKYIIGQDFRPDYSGVLISANIDYEIEKWPSIGEMHFYKEIGDPIFAPPEGYDNLGWITASGYSLLDAQDNLREAMKYVKFEVAKFAPESSFGKTSRKNSLSLAAIKPDLFVRAARIEKIRRMSKSEQKKLHVGIACNIFEEGENLVNADLMSVGRNIEKTLKDRGYKVTFFDFNNIQKAFKELSESDVDLVFNVCERINDSSLLEPHAAALLDILQIPYTGSNPSTLSLCIDKIRVKKLLAFHGIPTPKWDYVYSMDDEIDQNLRYPLIVKPSNTDNSIGITNESVVTNTEELTKQLKKVIIDLGSPALIEEYIEGDEYDVSILGSEENDLKVLPLSRSIFKDMTQGQWHIYTHDIKFSPDISAEKMGIVVQRPVRNISKKLETLLGEMALDTYNILDCHDYGRVEIRVDKDDNPYVLELNPNPSINMGDCVPNCAELTGQDYGQFIEEIMYLAIKRYKNRPPYFHLMANTK